MPEVPQAGRQVRAPPQHAENDPAPPQEIFLIRFRKSPQLTFSDAYEARCRKPVWIGRCKDSFQVPGARDPDKARNDCPFAASMVCHGNININARR